MFASLMLIGMTSFQLTRFTIGIDRFDTKFTSSSHRSNVSFRWDQSETNTLHDRFLTSLSQTQKFNILKRQQVDRLFKELRYHKGQNYTDLNDFRKNGMAGADFLIEGGVTMFELMVEEKPIAYSERLKKVYRIHLIAKINMYTSKDGSLGFSHIADIKMSGTLKSDLLTLVETAKRRAVEDLVGNLMDEIYPVQVIRSNAAEVYITLSKNPLFQVGKVYTVYQQGEALIDPQTGEDLGSTEIEVGRIQIKSIQKKFAKASWVKGSSASGNTAGAICRPAAD